jgi:hypothetical protein
VPTRTEDARGAAQHLTGSVASPPSAFGTARCDARRKTPRSPLRLPGARMSEGGAAAAAGGSRAPAPRERAPQYRLGRGPPPSGPPRGGNGSQRSVNKRLLARLGDGQVGGLRGQPGRRVALRVRSGTPGAVPACGAPAPPERWFRASPSPLAVPNWPGREGLHPPGTDRIRDMRRRPGCESGGPVRPRPFGTCQRVRPVSAHCSGTVRRPVSGRRRPAARATAGRRRP